MEFKDYYKILGVARTATEDDIRKAFRKLARQYHPDVAKDKTTAEARFKEINEAYEVLGDAGKRREYDELGSAWQQGGGVPPQWQRRHTAGAPGGGQGPFGDFEFGGTGFSDFFEMFFGGSRRRSGSFDGFGVYERGEAAAPADTEADLMVTLEEAVSGALRKITVRRTGGGVQGSRTQQTYDLRIPKGVYDGQRIRLAGQGEGVGGSSQRGDLYLRVKLAPHPDFRIGPNGDLYADLPLPAWLAVLGGEVTVPTLDGRAKLKIPPGTQHGQKFRLRKHGAPIRGGERGDLYAVAQIEVPTEVTPRQRELWRQLAEDGASVG